MRAGGVPVVELFSGSLGRGRKVARRPDDLSPGRMVSVVVSAYDAKDDLLECLLSLEAQTYEPLEVVVVDDASTDGTADALHAFAEKTALNLVVIENEQNSWLTK